jgi:hypothetical protein
MAWLKSWARSQRNKVHFDRTAYVFGSLLGKEDGIVKVNGFDTEQGG